MPKLFWELRVSLEGSSPVVVSRSERACGSVAEGTVVVPKALLSRKKSGKTAVPGKATLPLPRAAGGEEFLLLYLNNYAGGPLKYGTGKSMRVLDKPVVLEGRQASSFLRRQGEGLVLENHADMEKSLKIVVGRRAIGPTRAKASRKSTTPASAPKKTVARKKATKKKVGANPR